MTIRGISFPFRGSTTSFPAEATDNDVIRDNIVRILQTMKGSRVMRPASGSNTWAFVFENTGPVLNARMDHEVRKAIADGEPRANVLNVGVSEEDRSDGGINIVVTVTYVVNLDVQQAQVSFYQPSTGV
jgi:phage baseplate assembly protein W